MIDRRAIGPAAVSIEATAEERAALAQRFGLVAIDSLRAKVDLNADGAKVEATGTLNAAFVQACAVSGDDLSITIEEPFAFRFVPEPTRMQEGEEVELEEHELDEIEYAGTSFDLGEAVAQSLALAIDPYATGPEADRIRDEVGLDKPAAIGPFAALAALRKD